MQPRGTDVRELLAPFERHGVRFLIAEVESLRRIWPDVTGDPDLPIERVVHKRRLGEPAPVPPHRR